MPTEPKRKISELTTITTIPPGSFMIIETPTGTKKVSTDNLSFVTVVPDPEPVEAHYEQGHNLLETVSTN